MPLSTSFSGSEMNFHVAMPKALSRIDVRQRDDFKALQDGTATLTMLINWTISSEGQEWLDDNATGAWDIDQHGIHFEDESDAALFKLFWVE